MSDREEPLDLELRARVSALHGDPELPLSATDRERVIAAAMANATAARRAAPGARAAVWAVAALAAAAALVLFGRSGLETNGARSRELQCALPSPERGEMPRFEDLSDGRKMLELGRFGRLVADPTAQVTIERASACELTLALAAGNLAGDLQKLSPATLHVRAPRGEIVVRGTRFAVRANGGLEVVLLSGRVDVLAPGEPALELDAGKTLTMHERNTSVKAVTPEQARGVARLLEPEVAPAVGSAAPAPAPRPQADAGVRTATRSARADAKPRRSTAELLSQAESERRRGRVAEARAMYREAGAGDDENAQVALLRLTGFELDQGDAAAASAALAQHTRRFGHSALRVEALWLEVRVARALGEKSRALDAAHELTTRFPRTPQAEAARRWLANP